MENRVHDSPKKTQQEDHMNKSADQLWRTPSPKPTSKHKLSRKVDKMELIKVVLSLLLTDCTFLCIRVKMISTEANDSLNMLLKNIVFVGVYVIILLKNLLK